MMRALAVFSVLATSSLWVVYPAVADAPNAAHQLAEKFAEQRQSSASPAADREVVVKAPEKAPSASATRLKPSRDYEDDMLARARAEREAQKAAEAKAEADTSAAKVDVPGAEVRDAVSTGGAHGLAQIAGATTATAASPAPPAAATQPAATPAKADVKSPGAAEVAPVVPANGKQATLLLAIEMDGASKMAEIFQSLDLILCAGQTCFISKGLDKDALTLQRSEALRRKGADERGENACRGMAGCVFRNVTLPEGAQLRLVSVGSGIRIESHSFVATPDRTCDASQGELICDSPIATTDFRIWVVPETLAQRAGVELLEEAVADGLQQANFERTSDK